jgi:4-hydroxybenzoate polyprenyltransferase
MPGRIFDLFLFSSLFIAACAVLMVYQVNDLFQLRYNTQAYLYFVFFSTVCSYNFHWYLTPNFASENKRTLWTQQHKGLHLVFILTGLAGALVFFIPLREYFLWIGISILLTFLYSAPKLPFRAAYFLRRIAVGKTIFLALVWMYVTSMLPLVLSGEPWAGEHILFCTGRFFLIYAICIIFDFRDREQDKRDGVKSMITYFNERGINILFYGSVLVYFISTISLSEYGFPGVLIFVLLLPAFIVAGLYRYSKRNFSDYLYYFILDGMMAFSALFTSFLSF